MVDIDSKTLFNTAAAVTATIAVFYFIYTVQLGVSPVSKAALVILFLVGILAITQLTDEYQVLVLGYGVIVVSVLGLFFDLVNTFDVGDELTVVGLLVVASLLFALRMRIPEDGQFLSSQQAVYSFGLFAVLAVVILLVDITTGGLVYELQHNQTVEYSEPAREEVRIGSVVVSNPTPFPERVETPNYAVCPAGNWSAYAPPSGPNEPDRQVHLNVHVDDGYNEHVFGYGSETYSVILYMNGANLTGQTFPIQRTDGCPEGESGEPYVALFEAEEGTHSYRYDL